LQILVKFESYKVIVDIQSVIHTWRDLQQLVTRLIISRSYPIDKWFIPVRPQSGLTRTARLVHMLSNFIYIGVHYVISKEIHLVNYNQRFKVEAGNHNGLDYKLYPINNN
jgi:hypothetical protein